MYKNNIKENDLNKKYFKKFKIKTLLKLKK